eukprot:TRINITY_DN9198_c0_g1_i3.p2 TRINITY_DN9198_c0_g1~~TRINITY_DN9198_c0_g1_i3.p2  ORF type:complete len:188 (+),score=16.82 TRINITY_DN9198_c0_g1_i3:87-566(+)
MPRAGCVCVWARPPPQSTGATVAFQPLPNSPSPSASPQTAAAGDPRADLTPAGPRRQSLLSACTEGSMRGSPASHFQKAFPRPRVMSESGAVVECPATPKQRPRCETNDPLRPKTFHGSTYALDDMVSPDGGHPSLYCHKQGSLGMEQQPQATCQCVVS